MEHRATATAAALAAGLIAVAAAGCASAAEVGSSPTATSRVNQTATRERPTARDLDQMVLDPTSNRIFLEGGLAGDPLSQDIDTISIDDQFWIYDLASDTWTERATSPAGAGPIAFDAESGRLVKFIGIAPPFQPAGETWAYIEQDDTWVQQQPDPSPYGRLYSRAAYDSESDQIILFGGATADWELASGTWAYDLNRDVWQELGSADPPPPRFSHMMVYDSLRDRVLLWGGDVIPGFDQRPYLADLTSADYEPVWEYDRNTDTWTAVAPAGDVPPLRQYGAMVFDPASGRAIVHGGELMAGTALSDTWAYDPTAATWTLLSNDGPRITYHAMALDPTRHDLLLFGGQPGDVPGQVTDEMWRFDLDSNEWSLVNP